LLEAERSLFEVEGRDGALVKALPESQMFFLVCPSDRTKASSTNGIEGVVGIGSAREVHSVGGGHGYSFGWEASSEKRRLAKRRWNDLFHFEHCPVSFQLDDRMEKEGGAFDWAHMEVNVFNCAVPIQPSLERVAPTLVKL